MKIRSVLEYAAPVFTSMLTQQNIDDIERVQKIVLKTILDEQYSSYNQACQHIHTTSLQHRREHLSLRFALSCLKSPQHKHLFKERNTSSQTLRNIKSFEEPFCHSERYFSSPLPYLTRILTEHFSNFHISHCSQVNKEVGNSSQVLPCLSFKGFPKIV